MNECYHDEVGQIISPISSCYHFCMFCKDGFSFKDLKKRDFIIVVLAQPVLVAIFALIELVNSALQ